MARNEGSIVKGLISACLESFTEEYLPKLQILFTKNIEFKRKCAQDDKKMQDF